MNELIKSQRKIVRLPYEGSAEVRSVVAAEQVGTAELQHRLKRSDLIADLSVKHAIFWYHPFAEIRLPEKLFLPTIVDGKAQVLCHLSVGQTYREFVFRCVKAGAELAVCFAIIVESCIAIASVYTEPARQIVRETETDAK